MAHLLDVARMNNHKIMIKPLILVTVSFYYTHPCLHSYHLCFSHRNSLWLVNTKWMSNYSIHFFYPPACDCYTQGTVKPPDHNPEDPLPCDDKGRCSCKEKVIGDNCDSCQDTYWNVGSGNGCEQCLCDKTGSLNDSCDVITGQCPCKPGVSGRTCDQCQSDHFGFSDQGCQRKYTYKKLFCKWLHDCWS